MSTIDGDTHRSTSCIRWSWRSGGCTKDANTQVMQSSVGTVTGRVGKPDGSTVAGVMVGGTAQTGAEVIKQEMAREPFRR